MSDQPKITALVGCQFEGCAAEVSWHLADVRKLNGLPVCQTCYDEYAEIERGENGQPKTDWHDLPRIELSDLSR